MKKIFFLIFALCINISSNAQSIVIKLANGEEVRHYYHNYKIIKLGSKTNPENASSVQGIPVWQYRGKKLISAQRYNELDIALESDLSLETSACSGILDKIQPAGDESKIEIRYFSNDVEYENAILESISLPERIGIEVGETRILTPQFIPEDASCDVTWSSEDENIAVVNEMSGEITGVGIGTTTIYCVSDDAEHIASCQVTVFKTGDVNGDNTVDALDASLILQYVAHKFGDENTDFIKEAANTNNDNVIDALDASLVLQHAAKKIDLNEINTKE